jgi:hypothetical protein
LYQLAVAEAGRGPLTVELEEPLALPMPSTGGGWQREGEAVLDLAVAHVDARVDLGRRELALPPVGSRPRNITPVFGVANEVHGFRPGNWTTFCDARGPCQRECPPIGA